MRSVFVCSVSPVVNRPDFMFNSYLNLVKACTKARGICTSDIQPTHFIHSEEALCAWDLALFTSDLVNFNNVFLLEARLS